MDTNINMTSSMEKIEYTIDETLNPMPTITEETSSTSEGVSAEVYDIVVVLDESGSMDTIGKEAEDSVNKFFDEQKSLNIKGTNVTLVKFNSVINEVFSDIPLEDVPKFENFKPSDMTALYDAIGLTMKKKKMKGGNKVIFVILTDGQENCSKEYTHLHTIKKMIKDMETNHGWKFVYLAANQDAFSVGASYGINNCANFDATPDGFLQMTREVSGGITRLRSGESKAVNVSITTAVSAPVENNKPTPMMAPRMRRYTSEASPATRRDFIRDTGVDIRSVVKDDLYLSR